MEDLIPIPNEEREIIKGQVLQGLRQRYLRFKAEWLANQALGKVTETANWKAQMDEMVTAYNVVEADL